MTAEARASVEVPCDPGKAFAIFTADIGVWWKRGTRYWNDAARGLEYRLEPGVGGRLLEVYDGESFEVGRVLLWEPGRTLVFTWRQQNWRRAEFTEVEVTFEACEGGTKVTVEHSGWDRVASAGPGDSAGYSHGWAELLSYYTGEAH